MSTTIALLSMPLLALALWLGGMLRRRQLRNRKPKPWPVPSYEDVMKVDAVLRELSGQGQAERDRERWMREQKRRMTNGPDGRT